MSRDRVLKSLWSNRRSRRSSSLPKLAWYGGQMKKGNWQVVDQRLREYAHHRASLDAAEAFDLVQAERMRIYAFVGCATHFEYMERLLGYGPHTARERMRVARALATLPSTSAELARGNLNFSTVRELTRV